MPLIDISRLCGSTSVLSSAEAKRVRLEISSFHMPLKGCLHYYVYCSDPEVTADSDAGICYVARQDSTTFFILLTGHSYLD